MVIGDFLVMPKNINGVLKNAYKYGYILRYPPDKSHITGTTNEPWHFRYVGKDIAKIIYDNQWVLEDYTMNYGLASDNKKN